MLVHRLIKT